MSTAVVEYAFVLGMVALVNPCGFPLLPAYLSMFVGGTDRSWVTRIGAGLRAGLSVTVGFVAVFGAAGLATGLLRAVVLAAAPWLTIVIGAAILVYGALAVADRAPGIHVGIRFAHGRGFGAMAGFGVAYAIGSLSCSLPVFMAAVGGALAGGSAIGSVVVVAAYGVGMGLLATVLATLASLAGVSVLRRLPRAGAVLPRLAGVVAVLVGAYLIAYWVAQLGGPDLIGPLIIGVDRVQAGLTAAVQAAPGAVAFVSAGLVLAVLLAAALFVTARRHAASPRGTVVRAAGPSGMKEDDRR